MYYLLCLHTEGCVLLHIQVKFCLKEPIFAFITWLLIVWESGANAITVGRSIVVAVAIVVHIPETRGAVKVRRTQPPQAMKNRTQPLFIYFKQLNLCLSDFCNAVSIFNS